MHKSKILKTLIGIAKTIEADSRENIDEFQITEADSISLVRILWDTKEVDKANEE